MPSFTMSMIYLGNLPELDPADGNSSAENQAALLGQYYDSSDPAASHIVDVTADDANADGLTNSNEQANPETVTYDLGNGPVTTYYDSLFNVDVRIEFGSEHGVPDYVGLGGVVQTETGDTFLVMIDDDVGLGANDLDNFPINSITINSISAFGSQQWIDASDDQDFVPCFAAQTRLETKRGWVRVADLRAGDLVVTVDNGLQPIVWIGSRRLTGQQLQQDRDLRPVHIAPGALGEGQPSRDLFLSPQHRILVKSRIAQRMFGVDEVLLPCVQAVGLPGIRRYRPKLGIHYFHVLCEDHQLVSAEGAICETLYLGPQGVGSLSPEAQQEVKTLLPQLLDNDGNLPQTVRPFVDKPHQRKRLVERHAYNHKTLCDA
ncbi:Hint domain-containing protein [Epibacterium ulvae]|uniref:Hint domain-containing protein n=1 Tax=Epibacterium ulvae TaxID=1156985 RepID=UPI002490AC3D|nr:Hint domain-containing protein [Epibacterium ulvae]